MKLTDYCRHILLPMMLAHTVTAENSWNLEPIYLNHLFYFFSFIIAIYLTIKSPFRKFIYLLLLIIVFSRIYKVISNSDIGGVIAIISTSFVYIITGAVIYGKDYSLLKKQLFFFILISTPVMLIQILGIDPLFMVWDTSFLDDPLSSFNMSDVGKYKEISLYPTLFQQIENINFVIGQARPAGLSHNNNILSIFIVLALSANLNGINSSKLQFSDYVISLAAILSMSKLVFISMFIIYIFAFIISSENTRKKIIKLFLIALLFLMMYWFFFPGLFQSNLSLEMIVPSIFSRLNNIIYHLGFTDFYNKLYEIQLEYSSVGIQINNEMNKTLFASLLSIKYAYILFFIIPIAFYSIYKFKFNDDYKFYSIVLLACLLTQFGVPFYIASSFQLIVGFSLYPLIYGFNMKFFKN